MDGIHHQLQRWINETASIFRVEVASQSGEASQVSKKSSDGFPFTIYGTSGLHRRLLGENALG
jgi:hypothetical protein